MNQTCQLNDPYSRADDPSPLIYAKYKYETIKIRINGRNHILLVTAITSENLYLLGGLIVFPTVNQF